MSVQTSQFTMRPLTEKSRRIAEVAEHALLPVSPYDSYYSRARLVDLFTWARQRFARFDVWIPGHEAALGLVARGYSPEESVHRITRDLERLSGKVSDVMEELDLGTECRLLDWTLMENESYRALRFAATSYFENDAEFRDGCMQTCRYYLACMEPLGGPSDAQLRTAAGCYLPEVAMMIDTPGVLGVPSSVFCLDEPVPFVQRLFDGVFSWRPSSRQGCVLVTPEDDR